MSIVTPSYQMARFLGATIESVLSQDYPHIDYLVMDGGSVDGTRELLEGYGKRLRFVSAPDDGQADAVNKGFDRCDGDVFAFLNADDTYRPGAVRSVVEAFERDRGVGAIYGDADYVDADGQVVAPYPTEPFDRRRLASACFICQPAAFVSRAAWVACDGLDAKLQYALDYDLWIRLSERFRMLHLDVPLATSRMHPENKTLGSRAEHYRETIRVVKRHFGYVPMVWLTHAAAQRVDRVDQFYEQSHHGRRSRALAFVMAMRLAPLQPVRTYRDWQADGFYELFEDGWMSKAHVTSLRIPADASRLLIGGRHQATVRRPLVLWAKVNGRPVGARLVRHRGPFTLALTLPQALLGEDVEVELRSLWTWRPRLEGDIRRLSCFIDSVEAR